MDILPIIFSFSEGNVACMYHDFQQIPVYHTSISSSKSSYFFVHHGDIIAWAKRNVNQNLQWFVRPSLIGCRMGERMAYVKHPYERVIHSLFQNSCDSGVTILKYRHSPSLITLQWNQAKIHTIIRFVYPHSSFTDSLTIQTILQNSSL